MSRLGPAFDASVAAHRFPRVLIFDRRVAGVLHHRDAARGRRDGFDHFNLQVLRAGRLAAGALGEERTMRPGDVAEFDASRPQRTAVGRLADPHGRRRAFLLSRLGFAALDLPAFVCLAADRGAGALLAVSAGLAALNTLGVLAGLFSILEAMPGVSRTTNLALAYAAGTGLSASLTQLAARAHLARTGDPLSPAWLLVAAGLAGAAAACALPAAEGASGAGDGPGLTPTAPAPAPCSPGAPARVRPPGGAKQPRDQQRQHGQPDVELRNDRPL